MPTNVFYEKTAMPLENMAVWEYLISPSRDMNETHPHLSPLTSNSFTRSLRFFARAFQRDESLYVPCFETRRSLFPTY